MIPALLLTLAVEVPLYVLALTALRLATPARAALLGVAVNLLTHPVLWWLLALVRAPGGSGVRRPRSWSWRPRSCCWPAAAIRRCCW
ncbi:hypothetical protein [Dactylosporangium cerinum]